MTAHRRGGQRDDDFSVDQTLTLTDDSAPTVSLTAPADATVYLDATCFAADSRPPSIG